MEGFRRDVTTGAPRASVVAVVLNWCNEPDTAECLKSLAADRSGVLSVILVDNGSPDGSGDRLHERFPGIDYLQTGANLGYAGGNNRGFARALDADAQFVLVLNDDTMVDAECVDRLLRAAEETGAAVVAPRITYFDDPSRVWYAGGSFSRTRAIGVHWLENERVDETQTRTPITFVCGCCFLIRADVLRQVGGFDESFFAYVEDVDLSLRLSRAGHRLVYEPAARVLHRIKPNMGESPFQIRQRDRNRRRLVAKHYGFFDRMRFAAWFYPTRAVRLLTYLVRGRWAHARAILDGALSSIDPGKAPRITATR